jgi:hypothetical protein
LMAVSIHNDAQGDCVRERLKHCSVFQS